MQEPKYIEHYPLQGPMPDMMKEMARGRFPCAVCDGYMTHDSEGKWECGKGCIVSTVAERGMARHRAIYGPTPENTPGLRRKTLGARVIAWLRRHW